MPDHCLVYVHAACVSTRTVALAVALAGELAVALAGQTHYLLVERIIGIIVIIGGLEVAVTFWSTNLFVLIISGMSNNG